MSDYLIRDALIVDGTGKKAFPGSVLLKGDRIESIIEHDGDSKVPLPRARTVINARGKVLAPGFIDIHSHNDWLLGDPSHIEVMAPMIRQGVTTVVTGQCGFSPAPVFPERQDDIGIVTDLLCDRPVECRFRSMDSFFNGLEAGGIAVNMAHFAGHATLKGTLKGVLSDVDLSVHDLARIEYAMDECFEAGVFGLSFGLGYPPGMFSSREELLWFAKAASRRGGVLAVHLKALSAISPTYPYIPGGTPHNVIALNETLSLAREADMPLQISHLVFIGEPTWKTGEAVFGMIEREFRGGMDIAFDAFPYTGGNTTIVAVFPFWFLKTFLEDPDNKMNMAKLRVMFWFSKKLMKFDLGNILLLKAHYEPYRKYEGLYFREIARSMGMGSFDAYMDVARLSEGKARVLIESYYDGDSPGSLMGHVLGHPLCRFATDALITREGVQNPAAFGNFPKILGRFSRESNLMSLEEAVHKMTGASARRIGICRRGEILRGNFADLVLFDYNTIGGSKRGDESPEGMEYVFINGMPVLKGKAIQAKKMNGRVLRKTGFRS